MAIINQELFNGGTNGAAVSVSNAPGLTGVSNANFTFTTESQEGAFGAINPTGSIGTLDITLNNGVGQIYARGYFRRKAGSANMQFFHVSNTDLAIVAQVRWNSASNALQLRNGSTAVATSAYAWPLNDWVRIDWYIDRAGGTQTAQLFYGANLGGPIGSPSETITGACNAGTAANVKLIQCGLNAISTAASFIVDDFAVGDSWIGPYSSGGGGGGGTRTGNPKVWNGTAWVSHPAKVWNGTAWVSHPMKGYNGSSWIAGK